MTRYVALLRGINVGGKNLIKMADLRACFETHGFTNVATYIQSGNVLFEAPASGRAALARRVEALLAARFGYAASVVLRSHAQLRAVVARAPAGFGDAPARYRYDVLFLREPLTAAAALKRVPTRPGVDLAHAGPGVLYFRRLIAKAAQSQLNRIVAMPIYQQMTIRNWNTTTTLLRLLATPAT
jgi:uncharacterized protein (DUF1697 family)